MIVIMINVEEKKEISVCINICTIIKDDICVPNVDCINVYCAGT